MKAKNILFILPVLAAIAAYFACVSIEPYQEGVIFKSSGPEILGPGFYANVPFISSIQKMDMRTQSYTISGIPVSTKDHNNIMLDVSVLWSIQNDMSYAKATHADPGQINSWLNAVITESVRQAMNKQNLSQILGQTSNSLAQSLQASLAQEASQKGIQILDINIQNIAYAPSMLSQVYQNMQAQAADQVKQIQSQGQQQAAQITEQGKIAANAVINQAYIQAATIKGQGEAKAQIIYNQAYSKDPQFYAFWRSMQLYQALFSTKNTVLVVKPEGQFLQYLNSYKP